MPEQPGAFLMCDGCGAPTPMLGSKAEVRSLAASRGWAVDVGELSEDYCELCKDSTTPT